MADLSEITRLFSKLASDLQPSDPPSDGLSSLVASLNSDDAATPGSRVLDAALSLMCFNSTEVFNSRIKCLLSTIISALSASVSCQGLCSDWAEPGFVRVGSSVSFRDCCEIIRLCGDAIRRLKGHYDEELLHDLSRAVLKLAVSTSPFKAEKGEIELIDPEMRLIISELKHNLIDEIFPIENEIPLRVFLWSLDPSILRNEISEALNEATCRPFICLRNEIHDRPAWRFLILCCVCSPFIIMEIRALLHYWFLDTGFSTIWEFQNAIVSSILDVLSKPMSWGVPIELGLNYLSAYAYFPDKNRELLAILVGPISCAKFLDLFCCVNSETELEPSAETVEFHSSWGLVINFPNWYYFAAAILFYRDGSQEYISKFIHDNILTESIDETMLINAACHYLAWILNPIDKSKFTSLAKQLSVLSRSWVKSAKTKSRRPSVTRTKKLSIRKADEFEKPNLTTWLEEFQRHCFVKNLLCSKIPLGILIASPGSLDSSELDLLLHYAATGEILDSKSIPIMSPGNFDSKKQAIDGARFVMNFFDSIEELSLYLFECEDARLLYLSRLRGSARIYLFRCVKFLLEVANFDRDNIADLYGRLVRWKDSGALHGFNEFENMLNGISLKYCL